MTAARVCLQWTVVVFNVLTLIIGGLAVAAAVYEYLYFSEGSVGHIDKWLQLGVAGALILSALIGCTGASVASIKVLVLYIILLLVMICAHIWKLAHYSESKQLAATEVYVIATWMQELERPGAMNQMQQEYECCGDKRFTDYTSLGLKVPKSCFHTEDGLHALYPYTEGCMVAVKRVYLQIYRYEKWVHCGLMAYEILGIVLAITLCCQLTNKTRRYNY
ncbi:protein late bloomer [Scaptodrosophila lebanonensis]|uniref:Protein late bloomer n=1 Tax=Drosophila lebanonensis TaxID=7225 RepID=A0A6J2UHR8_DROLE|nr:protein late bloomer [Scaptodrosophila lebanonensis]